VKLTIAAAGLSLVLMTGAAAAQSSWVEGYETGLSSRQITSIVRSAGLRPVSSPARRGHRYIVDAVDSYGETKRVVIDADYGDIMRIVSLSRRGAQRYSHRYSTPSRWYDDDGPVVRPPATVGSPRYAYEPRARMPGDAIERPRTSESNKRTAAVNPTQRVQPPLPRSRPGIAVEPRPGTPETPAAATKPGESAPDTTASTAPTQTPKSQTPATKKATETSAQPASPRVVLPGGPTPKGEREASSTRGVDQSATAPKNEPDAASKMPPMQSLE
jgi:hypothetical protein